MAKSKGVIALTTIPTITPGERRFCVSAEDPSAAPVELGETDVLVDVKIGVGDEREMSIGGALKVDQILIQPIDNIREAYIGDPEGGA